MMYKQCHSIYNIQTIPTTNHCGLSVRRERGERERGERGERERERREGGERERREGRERDYIQEPSFTTSDTVSFKRTQ